MKWNEFKKGITSISQDEIKRIEAVADGNSEEIKKIASKSVIELEEWEIEVLQNLVLEQQEEIEKIKLQLSVSESNRKYLENQSNSFSFKIK